MFHERKPTRLRGYDYSKDNFYFITTCVQNRICCFGKIIRDEMILTEYGFIAYQQWHWLQNQYPYVLVHAFVIMPNHVHAIIEINRDYLAGTGRGQAGTGRGQAGTGRGQAGTDHVGTGRDLSLRDLSLPGQNLSKSQKIKSLSELMGAYKTTTSKKIHLSGNTEFAWERSFHDHIIRDKRSYNNMCNYIRNNPACWKGDDLFL